MRQLSTHLQRLEEKADGLVQDTPHFPHIIRKVLADAQARDLACSAEEAYARGDTAAVERLMNELWNRLESLPDEDWTDPNGETVPGVNPTSLTQAIYRECVCDDPAKQV